MKKDSKEIEKDIMDGLKELEELEKTEGFKLFGDDDDEDYDDEYYEDDLYEGMEDEKESKKEASKKEADEMVAEIDKLMADMENEEKEEGFGNMFNLDISKNCMILIVIVLILILCKEDIMKMSFFKKLFK